MLPATLTLALEGGSTWVVRKGSNVLFFSTDRMAALERGRFLGRKQAPSVLLVYDDSNTLVLEIRFAFEGDETIADLPPQ